MAAVTVALGCTTKNPAYETTGAGTEGDPTSVEMSEGQVGTEGASESSGVDTTAGGMPVPSAEYCRSDLLAVNDHGELYLVDVDEGEAMLQISDTRIRSWAIATEPGSGTIYINSLDEPGIVWVVDPYEFEIDEVPLGVAVEPLEVFARSTFHDGDLWLGTEENHRFIRMSTSGDFVHQEMSLTFPRGGDMVFLEPSCAVVATLDASLHRVCFPVDNTSVVPPPEIDVEGLEGAFTGLAVDGMGRMWLSILQDGGPLYRVEYDDQPWAVVQTLELQVPLLRINDLAAVVELPGC